MYFDFLSSEILLKQHFHCSPRFSVMVESVLFSLPDLAAISDEHLRLRATIKAVNYHQSEEIHLALRVRSCYCAERHLKL